MTTETLSSTAAADVSARGIVDKVLLEATTAAASSSDLFGGELGEYELNEIPSLFNLDTQQMGADLESLGFSTSGAESSAENELPFIPTTSSMGATTSTTIQELKAEAVKTNTKRTAAEISEDESSQSSKARRVTTRAPAAPILPNTTNSSAVVPVSPKSRPLAPKPPSSKKTKTAPIINRNFDTSTAHVKALTGSKGAAMCFDHVAGTERDTTVAIPNLGSDHLSAEEKAKFSRDRNRLHARNTRIRKKAYVDELKRTLDVLVQERDGIVEAKNRKVQIEREERDVRYSVLEEFLRLRGRNEQAPARWNAILEETVTLRLPNLDRAGGHNCKKVVSGVPELMKECHEFNQQVSMQGARNTMLNFQCDRPSLLMEGANVVLDWTATSNDPAKANALMRGTCRASFNPHSNKLHAIELFFDSTPLMG